MNHTKYTIACVKSSSYQDLWVTDISNNAFGLFKSSMMRCPPIGLVEQYDTQFIIVKESNEPPCQEIRSCIPDQYKHNLRYSQSLKNPTLPFLDETFHKEISIDSVSHNADDIDWSTYNIVLTINACIPNRIIEKYPNVLWCYYVGENDGRIDMLLGKYDVILNQDVMRGNLPPHAVGFPYTFVGPTTIEDMNKQHLQNDVSKNGIFIEINNTQERPVKTVPPAFAKVSEKTNMPVLLHNQNIIENTKNIYSAKYFVKLFGRGIRGNSIVEAVSAGTLILANRRLITYADLIPVKCHVENKEDLISKILYYESHPEEYATLIKLQRALLDKYYFKGPVNNLIARYEKKQNRIDIFKNMDKSLVWITLINHGYVDYTKNFLISLEKANVPMTLVVYCIDTKSMEELASFKNCVCVDANIFLKDTLTSDFKIWENAEYRKICFAKLDAIYYTLKTTHSLGVKAVGIIDTDIIILKNPTDIVIEKMEKYKQLNIFTQCDERQGVNGCCSNSLKCPNFCAGIIVFRNVKENYPLFLYNKEDVQIVNADQAFLLHNFTKRSLSYLTIERNIFLNGTYPGVKSDGPLVLPESACLIHFNWMFGHEKKTYMKKHGMWWV